jgi:pimeloyl-ACP methyl ester carboxylesterase/predicted glycosyltransferase
MQALYPDHEGDVVRDGVKTHYYVYGQGERTILLMPTWSLIHARHWKGQVPYLSRHYRIITIDGRGNGQSDRPTMPEAYSQFEILGDVVAVLDATATKTAVVSGVSMGGHLAGLFAALHPERAQGAVLIAPAVPFGPAHPGRDPQRMRTELDAYKGWDKFNVHFMRDHHSDFAQWFAERVFSEPHSTKQIQDLVEWALDSDGATLALTRLGRTSGDGEDLYKRIRCPVLVIHGDQDEVVPYGKGAAVAELTGGTLVTIAGGGHGPQARDPVLVNRLIKDFADRVAPHGGGRVKWTRGLSRRKKVLFLPAHAGLGHARRALAVAQELRALHPDAQIDWLTTDPVDRYLAAAGEQVHPASRLLVSESAHFESEAGEHDLHVFQTLRNMDEIMVSNFMTIQDVVEQGQYDLVVGDEAWDLDYFWHENPELKRGSLAWLTDFVGFVPFADGGEWEQHLTTDYNAEMIEHVERFPWMRDRAIFIGNSDDIVPEAFGPGLPTIRDWTQRHFDFSGYIAGYDPAQWGDPAELRAQLGYRPDEKVCIVTVGGTGVGVPLLKRIMDAWPAVHRRLPELRMVLVTGPRIDPAMLSAPRGVELRPYVPDLVQHLTVCDLALVQGGLTTCMELTAAQRPFLYFPLQHHFEQSFHVHHRLQRYGAGRRMDYAQSDPDAIAEAMVAELGREMDYRPVETDGAVKAAALLAEMI